MACDLPMVLSHESRLRVHGLANGHPFVTSRIERESRGLAEKTRGLAGDRIEARRLQIDDRPEKALGVRVARLPEQRRVAPSSAIRPAYMTATRSENSATSPR